MINTDFPYNGKHCGNAYPEETVDTVKTLCMNVFND